MFIITKWYSTVIAKKLSTTLLSIDLLKIKLLHSSTMKIIYSHKKEMVLCKLICKDGLWFIVEWKKPVEEQIYCIKLIKITPHIMFTWKITFLCLDIYSND